jgi:hypothetical protein
LHKFRQIKLLLKYLIKRVPSDPLRPVISHFWIGPFDVELTRTVSHTYLAFAGLGRWDWSFHNINWRGLLRERWAPLTHSELIHYRRAAPIFSRVEVVTSLLWWDDKMAYLEHRMMCRGRLSATVYSRGTFFAGRERISPSRCVVGLPQTPSGPKPQVVSLWEQADALFSSASSE